MSCHELLLDVKNLHKSWTRNFPKICHYDIYQKSNQGSFLIAMLFMSSLEEDNINPEGMFVSIIDTLLRHQITLQSEQIIEML